MSAAIAERGSQKTEQPQPKEWGVTLSAADFSHIRKLAYDHFGLDLKQGKEAQVSARLSKRIRDAGLSGVKEYLARLDRDASGEALRELVDDLTTHYTSFLREREHFDWLRERVLADWPSPQQLRIWSAGCSTGEEPYSILFTVMDAEPSTKRLELFATDVSRPVLESSASGVYEEERLKGLPPGWGPRYFQKGHGRWAGFCRVKADLRSRIRFDRVNLMEPMGGLPSFHVIFCRNVMIYFDRATQERLVSQFVSRLEPGGYLFIGHSEGLMAINHSLEFLKAAIYRKPGRPSRR
ncbi:MAG: protein-glutamate O-methyltransferase CheR [Acidobacteria bacterium]|nr:protein-glutamate O-methyltransferase CheR [Acidobacteriota bacterium]